MGRQDGILSPPGEQYLASAMSTAATLPDWTSLGLFLMIVGGFLLASALVLRPPREWVEQALGLAAPRLARLREQIFHRVQLGVGFLYILGGLALQIYGRQTLASDQGGEFPALWAGALVVSTVLLLALGWWYASRSFRKELVEVLQTRAVDLVSRPELAKEIGLLIGVRPEPGETTELFAQRIQRALGLRPAGARSDSRREELEELDETVS